MFDFSELGFFGGGGGGGGGFGGFFEDFFSAFAHFMMGDLWAHLPTPRWVSAVYDQKTAWPPCHPPIDPISPGATVFVSPVKNILKGKRFANVEEVKQKMAEALKGIEIKFKNCFEQWKKNASMCVLCQMKNALKVTEV